MIISHLLNGIHVGSIYALVALGYSMVYGIIKLINFAHGDIIMVGSYVAWFTISALKLPVWMSLLLTVLCCIALGVIIEKVAYKPLRSSPRISLLISAIGISLLLENLAQLIFSSAAKPFPTLISGYFTIGNQKVEYTTLVTIVISVVLMLVLSFLVNKTRMGRAMRAVSEDTDAAQLMGVNVNNTISFTFAVGSALAAVAAILYCCSYPQVKPTMGSMLGLKAFVAAVLGGIGSIPGAVVGAFAIGIAEALVKSVNSQISDAIVFGILIITLLIKPTGLLGKNVSEKV